MAQLNSQIPMNSAPEPEVQPSRKTVWPVVGVLAALALAAGALVYYQSENGSRSASAPQATTSDNAAFAPATTPSNTESTPSSPKTGADESAATANAARKTNANAKPHRLAKASKPESALQPRDRQVFLSTRPQPAYPVQALRAGEEGTVLVLAQVDVNGRVTDAHVIRHSGSSILDRAAPNEVRQWKFEPALRDGRPVVASVEVPVRYTLNQ